MNTDIERYFSSCRLASYLLPGEAAEIAFTRYQWNLQLAEAMLPSLNYLEVGLRNALNEVIIGIYGVDWLLTIPSRLGLSFDDIRDIESLKKNIQATKGYPARHDDVLARLGFGFWIAFFHKRYIPGIWSRGKTPLVSAFPNMASLLRTRELIFSVFARSRRYATASRITNQSGK